MPQESATSANMAIGGAEFWKFYDEFCQESNLKKLIEDSDSPMTMRMREITTAAHRSREIHKLKRPEKNWDYHRAWLALADAPIQNPDGTPIMYMRPGDVVVIEWPWDRDVIVTHVPISEHISGYLLSGKWDPMIGLFLPLFSHETIARCVELRVTANLTEAMEKVAEEAKDSSWPK